MLPPARAWILHFHAHTAYKHRPDDLPAGGSSFSSTRRHRLMLVSDRLLLFDLDHQVNSVAQSQNQILSSRRQRSPRRRRRTDLRAACSPA